MSFELPKTYKDVAQRIADLKALHPDAILRPANPDHPFEVVTIGDKTFVAYAAACYRTPNDPLPAIGVAWEPFPGRTPYTRDSELMNAETSAWGRAIVAALRSESRSIASADEVRNRQDAETVADAFPGAEPVHDDYYPPTPTEGRPAVNERMNKRLFALCASNNLTSKKEASRILGRRITTTRTLAASLTKQVMDQLDAQGVKFPER